MVTAGARSCWWRRRWTIRLRKMWEVQVPETNGNSPNWLCAGRVAVDFFSGKSFWKILIYRITCFFLNWQLFSIDLDGNWMATIMTHCRSMNFSNPLAGPGRWCRRTRRNGWGIESSDLGYSQGLQGNIHVEFLSFGTSGVGRAWMKELFFFVWLEKNNIYINTFQVADFQWFPGEDQIFSCECMAGEDGQG